MSHIRKVVITSYGDESKLALVDADLVGPAAGEVQIEVEYSVVAGSDVNMRRGTYPFQKKPPLTPGYSVVGTVKELGEGAKKFKLGERVACLTKYDGQQTRTNQLEAYVVKVPDEVDPQQAVAVVLDWMTAYQMLYRRAKVREGQRMFVHGMSGGVGAALLCLGNLIGAEVFGTASAGKHEAVRDLGGVPFDYGNKDWIAAMQEFGGVDAVFDPLGYESFDESYSVLRKGGTLVAYGLNLPGLRNVKRGSALLVILKLNARNLMFWTGKHTLFFGLDRASAHFNEDLAILFGFLQDDRLKVPIKGVFNMEQVQDAHRAYAKSDGVGSLILRVK